MDEQTRNGLAARLAAGLAPTAWLLAAAVVFVGAASVRRLPRPPPPDPPPAAAAWPAPVSFDGADSAVWGRARSAAPPAGALDDRYRLAGTYLSFSDLPLTGVRPARKAILDDLDVGRQHLVAEGDRLDGLRVLRIYEDRVIVLYDGREEELWMGFRQAGASESAKAAAPPPGGEAGSVAPSARDSRFGRRVGENRWVFEQDRLMEYYHEMLDHPERAVAVYESMRPNYVDEGIQGYVVDIVGEADFFREVGLEPGDLVRKVNSLDMSSRRRAEYFIGEFVNERLGAVVLDIERGGEARKLIYLIR
jgi:type II secretory pathway component PulC